MEKIVIIGAGGFGREIQWLIERSNQKKKSWDIIGYIDDNVPAGTIINGYRVLGGSERLRLCGESISAVCAIGNAAARAEVIEKISNNKNLKFPNMIDPSIYWAQYNHMGKGNIICAGNNITCNVQLGDFNILNLVCTVGHDVKIENFVTVYPGANISGNVFIEDYTEIGTGSKIIQGIHIGKQVILGAGTVVVKSLTERGTYAGVPARRIK